VPCKAAYVIINKTGMGKKAKPLAISLYRRFCFGVLSPFTTNSLTPNLMTGDKTR